MLKKAVGSILAVFAIASILSACGKESADEGQTQSGTAGTIAVAVTQDSNGDKLDATTYNGARAIQSAIYDPLVEFNQGKVSPGLAESWETSEDGKTYIFHLKKGIRFSDGSTLDSSAVKFSLERTMANPDASSLEVTRKLALVETPDSDTVVLRFKEIATQALLELSQARPFRVMSPNAVTPAGALNGEFVRPIGTGPWQLESYKEGVETVLTSNPHYWNGTISANKLIFKVITDPQARVLALQSGEIDIAGGEIGNIPYENLALFENNPRFKVEQNASTMSYFVVINQNHPALADIRVRQALNYATDTSKMMGGHGAEVGGLFQKTVSFVTSENQLAYAYDVEKAKQLLEASGYRWNEAGELFEKNGRPLEFKLVIQTDEYPEWKEMAEIFQDQMKKAGIKITITNQEKAAYYDTLWTNKQYDLLFYRTYTDAQLPYRFLTSLFYDTAKTPAVAYRDEKLSKLLDEIAGTVSDESQQKLFNQVFLRLHEEAMTVPLFYTKQTFIHRTGIRNFRFGAIEDNPVRWHELVLKD